MRLIQEGPKNARIVIVGEAPGATEDASGLPFAGGSGELLNRMLSRVGINRSECFVTNVCHQRPPGNDFNYFLKGGIKPELVAGLVQLKRDLEEIKPNLIIALGSQPLRFLTGKQGIDKWRGSILPCKLVAGLKVIGTYHPAYILRVYDYKAVAEFDLQKCKHEAEFASICYPKRTFYFTGSGTQRSPEDDRIQIIPTDLTLREALINEMVSADWLAVDIECVPVGDKWRISCVGFSDVSERALVIAIESDRDMADVKRLCESPVRKVMQNGTFDCTVLADNGVQVANFAWDIMLAHHSRYPECASGSDEISRLQGKKRQAAIAKGLGFQTSLYTNEPYYKDDGKLWGDTGDLQLFWRYNALDAAVTREIRDVQQVELEEFGAMGTFQHEMSLVRPLMDATRIGLRVDLDTQARLLQKYTSEIDNLQKFLNLAAGGPVNVKSSPQVKALLYDRLGLPVQRKRGTGAETADKDAIAALGEKYSHPVLGAIIQIRERRDLVERYLNCPVDADGRIRCSFDITGTRTGRLSSRASIYGSGSNLQNQPPEIREMYVSDEGKIFIIRDYKQAEAQVVAYLAEEEDLIAFFNDPTRDVHKENAARIFNKRIELVTKEERYLAKKVIHASNYGMGPARLVQVVNQEAAITGIRINYQQAKQLMDLYFMLYPKIKEVFWREVEEDIRRTRTLVSPFGRKREFFGRVDEKLLNQAYAYKPQSAVGDLACKAFVRCYHELPKEVDTLVNVHDSILVQAPVEMVDEVVAKMEELMAIPIPIKGRSLVIPTDCKVGFNWGDRGKDGYNPRGLIDYEKWLKEKAA